MMSIRIKLSALIIKAPIPVGMATISAAIITRHAIPDVNLNPVNMLGRARGTLVEEKVYPPERDTRGEPPRIGVFICSCGLNIGGVVRTPEVAEYAKMLPNVVHLVAACSLV